MRMIAYDFQDLELFIKPDRVKLLPAATPPNNKQKEVSVDFQLPEDLGDQVEALVMQTLEEADDRSGPTTPGSEILRAPRLALRDYGQSLFRRLFPEGSDLVYEYLASYMPPAANAKDRLVRLRLRLRLDSQLTHIPWEILCASENVAGAELALNASVVRTPVIRPEPAQPVVIRSPLQLLLVADNPVAPDQQLLKEQEQLIHNTLSPLSQMGLIQVHRLAMKPHETTTLQALGRVLEEEEIHVLHLIGHGYDDLNKEKPAGYLVMTRNGERYDYTGQEVSRVLAAGVARSLRLVVLNASDGARQQPLESRLGFTGVAQALLDVGIPAVLAMQYELSHPAAKALSENFYRRLVETSSVDEAVRHSRYYLLQQITDTLEWVTPVLFLGDQGRPFELASPAAERPAAVPHQFASYVEEKSRGFVGRDYVFAAIDAFIDQNPKGYFEVEGDPGVGKSAILAEFVRRTGAISHFNIRSMGVNTSRHFLESICTQLIQRYGLPYPSLPPEATRDGSFLAQLLEQAATELHPGERLLIAVDALDEVDDPTNDPNSPANILYLPRILPEGVYFIMTRRQFRRTFRVDRPYELLDLMKYKDESAQDVQTFIWRAVETGPKLSAWIESRPEALSREAFVVELTRLSERNFMYLHHVLPAIERGDYEDLNIEALPVGLHGYYQDHWVRMRAEYGEEWETRIKIVYVLSEAKQPISVQLISEFADAKRLLVSRVLREWDEFLREEKFGNQTRYSVYHASFRDFLHRQDIVQDAGVEIQDIHGMIADDLWTELFGPEDEDRAPQPDVTRLRHYLAENFTKEELRTLCVDLGINHENIPGDTLNAFARELITYLQHRGRLPELIEAGRRLRPTLDW